MNRIKEEFCISALSHICKDRFKGDVYSIGKPQESSVCIEKVSDKWIVYEKEKNSQNDLMSFDNIIEASIVFLGRLCIDNEYSDVKSAFFDEISMHESVYGFQEGIEDRHYELILGRKVFKGPSTPLISRIMHHLQEVLMERLRPKHSNCIAFTYSVALWCSCICKDVNNTFLLPDLMMLYDPKRGDIQEDGVYKAPDFICDAVLDSTQSNDIALKKSIYMKIGVKEYWIFNPEKWDVIVYRCADQYRERSYSLDLPINTIDGIEIDFRAFRWRDW